MTIKIYDYLHDDAKGIRKTVFMKEQGFVNEFDDADNIARHFVMYNDSEQPIATCRVFALPEKGAFVFGRLAVLPTYRGMDIGSKMISEAEKTVIKDGAVSMIIHAQCRVKGFYEKSGYSSFGDVDDDEGCAHIWMKKVF